MIVTARGARPHIEACLQSLRESVSLDGGIHVVVVDNASRDGTVEVVCQGFPEVQLIELDANLGFSAANNVGIATGRASRVLVLNPDTVMSPSALNALVAALDANPRVAVVGPRLIDRAGRPDHNAKRRIPTPSAALRHFLGGAGAGYAVLEIDERGVGPVDAVSGACMLVRREAINAVGGFDEGYWMYGEDLDWCCRFRAARWEVWYLGTATVLHVKHGLTGSVRSLRVEWAFHRSMGRFYRAHQAGDHLVVDLLVYMGVLSRFVAMVLTKNLRQQPRG